MTCFPAAPLTVRRPNVVRPSLPIRKEGERTRAGEVVDVVVVSAFESERLAGLNPRSAENGSLASSLTGTQAQKKGRGSESAFASKGGKRQPHCSHNYKSDFKATARKVFACFVEEASKSERSNEEQPRPMNSQTSLPPPRAQCLTGARALARSPSHYRLRRTGRRTDTHYDCWA